MRTGICSAIALFVLAFAPAAAGPGVSTMERGQVRSGDRPIPFARVTLYRAGGETASGAVSLGSDVADLHGRFAIHYQPVVDPDAVLYLIAEGPWPTTRLATVLGTRPFTDDVTINERTTIATAYAMAQFIDGRIIGGKRPGLQNAAGTLRNLVDLETGDVGQMLATPPNGDETRTMRTFNSLANALAGAVRLRTTIPLLLIATPPGGPVPRDTLQAAINIAHYQWRRPLALYLASRATQPYGPALLLPPITWTLAIKYIGNGHEFDGPAAIAFDVNGDAWIGNNYMFRYDHSLRTCGGKHVLKLTATGQDAPGAPYDGSEAGVDGVGFGIAVDPKGSVWTANFGFFGSTCPCEFAPPGNTVSRFNSSGQSTTPPGGFMQGCIAGPQGIISDQKGGIWTANYCGGTVTFYAAGDPDAYWVYSIDSNQVLPRGECPQMYNSKPFGIAIDHNLGAWVTDNLNDAAFRLSPEGVRTARVGPEAGICKPMGIAIAGNGDVWISNSRIVDVPCVDCIVDGSQDYGDLTPDLQNASVTRLDADGNFIGNYTGGGLWIPWGIATDGNGDVWVANFGGKRVSAFHGDTGQPIAPHGYFSDALERVTNVAIDTAGNVWLANNWLIDAVQTNPGGDGMVVFIGLAAPVKTPLLGPPERP